MHINISHDYGLQSHGISDIRMPRLNELDLRKPVTLGEQINIIDRVE